jgi:hypothetical protein
MDYAEAELKVIKVCIDRKTDWSDPTDLKDLGDKTLEEKLQGDTTFKDLGLLKFFPAVLELSDNVKVQNFGRNRDYCLIISNPDKKIVVKKRQCSFEPEIARKVAELGVGPRLLGTLNENIIVEEFVEGKPFTYEHLRSVPRQLGERVGEIYKLMHEAKIMYCDYFKAGDFRESAHLIVNTQDIAKSKFVDFGVATPIKTPKEMTSEEFVNWCFTIPGFGDMYAVDPENAANYSLGQREFMIKKGLTIDEMVKMDISLVPMQFQWFPESKKDTFILKEFFEAFNKGYGKKAI